MSRTVTIRDLEPGRRYTLELRSGKKINGELVRVNEGCCVQMKVKGDPHYSVAMIEIEGCEEAR